MAYNTHPITTSQKALETIFNLKKSFDYIAIGNIQEVNYMSKAQKEKSQKPTVHKKSSFSVKKDSKTGLFMLSGPSFTKEDVDKSFPEDQEDRVSTVMRRSVGL